MCSNANPWFRYVAYKYIRVSPSPLSFFIFSSPFDLHHRNCSSKSFLLAGSSPIRLFLMRTRRDFFIVLSQVVYCKLKWIIQTAGFHFALYISRPLPRFFLRPFPDGLHSKERYRCLGKGFQMEVMVIRKIPFQMWLKFRKNQQRLIGVMTHRDPVTNSFSPFATFLYHVNVKWLPALTWFPMQWLGYRIPAIPSPFSQVNHLSVVRDQPVYIYSFSRIWILSIFLFPLSSLSFLLFCRETGRTAIFLVRWTLVFP